MGCFPQEIFRKSRSCQTHHYGSTSPNLRNRFRLRFFRPHDRCVSTRPVAGYRVNASERVSTPFCSLPLYKGHPTPRFILPGTQGQCSFLSRMVLWEFHVNISVKPLSTDLEEAGFRLWGRIPTSRARFLPPQTKTQASRSPGRRNKK